MEENVSKIGRTVINFFGEVPKRLGKAVKFVQRRSKLTAELFAETLIASSYIHSQTTLEQMCQLLRHKGVRITKQGLDKRFTPQATKLLKNLFKEALEMFKGNQAGGIDLLKLFTHVYSLDSSSISLPDSMQGIYQGFGGGSASEAGLKLQILLDYVEGQVKHVDITAARKNDQSYKGHLRKIQKGALYLQDLGYFSIASFKKLDKKGAYFISRYLAQTKVYDDKGDEIDLISELNKSNGSLTLNVKLGKKEKNKVAVQLTAKRLSEEEMKQRLDKINKAAKKKGRVPTEETLLLAKWSIFITNIPTSLVTDEQIYLLYTLRWQIELFFKLCKSEAGIERISSKNPDRVQCELYAKLISVVLLLYFCAPIRWQEKEEISWRKSYKRLQQYGGSFFKALGSLYHFLKFFREFLDDLKSFALKDRYKKKRPATYKKLMLTTGQEVLI